MADGQKDENPIPPPAKPAVQHQQTGPANRWFRTSLNNLSADPQGGILNKLLMSALHNIETSPGWNLVALAMLTGFWLIMFSSVSWFGL